jgi:hypothetical protein
MQYSENGADNCEKRDGIWPVPLAQRLNIRGTALRAIHNRMCSDRAPTSNEKELSRGYRERG